ncbi:Uncharacterised protein [Escherichia coli]|nr:Uncharacterised protein [Escherichia coli]
MQFCDLPEPDSPTIPSVSPARREKFKSLTAVTSPSGVLKVTRKSFTFSSASACCCASGTVAVSITLMAALLNDLFGSRASRKPSPIKLKQNSVTTRNPAGNNNNHGETSIEFAPSLSNAPQLLNGSCVPNPRKLRKDSKRIMLGTRSDA